MSGIVFLRTTQFDTLTTFYTETIGAELWLDQGECRIFRHGSFLFGFCNRDSAQTDLMLTFFYDSKEGVDRMYDLMKDAAEAPPAYNERFRIYQFFAKDPEGRPLEFQYFDHLISAFRSGDDLLRTRRSVREFTGENVKDDTIRAIIDSCRFAPTSYNSQPQYYRVIRDRETISYLAEVHASATIPIGNAPVAVAICADSAATSKPVEDGWIAAYHFMLAAWWHGLGTCFIGSMDQEEVKARLGIPEEHYLVTVTPLGYPSGGAAAVPSRKELGEFIR